MTAPQPAQPASTPGDQREDTALLAGAAVGAVMTAASLALVALVGASVLKVMRGASRRRVARELHAAAQAIVGPAVARARQVLAEAEQQIVEDTTTALEDAVPGRPGTFRGADESGRRIAPPQPPALATGGRPQFVPFGHPEPSTGGPTPPRRPHPPAGPGRSPLALPAAPSIRSAAESIRAAGLNAIRDVDDVFAEAAEEVAFTGAAGTQAAQKLLDKLAEQGVTVFVDKSGRPWELGAYCEMAARTATSRLALITQLQLMAPRGLDLVVVDAPSSELGCKKCAPWEGRVLSLAGRAVTGQWVSVADAAGRRKGANVAGTLAEAVEAGLFHPNAVLGDQPVRVLGEVENGVKAWYDGPSVHLSTARGHHLAVSPNHPVLTPRGWLPAKAITQGAHVFSTRIGQGAEARSVADVDLDDPESTFEDELDALAAHGSRAAVSAAADHLHGDGRFCQGEVEVVVADRGLLSASDLESVQMACEGHLPWPDMELARGSGAGPALLRGLRVARPVGRTLADLHPLGLEAPTDRRLADAETVGEILGGLSADVELDEVIEVRWGHHVGHAYDLQTTTGAYVAGSILVHNCRHFLAPFVDGAAHLPLIGAPRGFVRHGVPHYRVVIPDHDSASYKAQQRQRELERLVRKQIAAKSVALTPVAKAQANRRLAAARSTLDEHVKTYHLTRQRYREIPGKAR